MRKPINWLDGYELDSSGTIYSYCTGGFGRTDIPKIKATQLGNSGYEQIKIRNKWYSIHRLVAIHFVEGYFEGAVVDHIDGNKLNNDMNNLRWVTQKDNLSHIDKTINYTNCILYGGREKQSGRWFKTLTDMRSYVESEYGISGKSLQKYCYNKKAGLLLKKV